MWLSIPCLSTGTHIAAALHNRLFRQYEESLGWDFQRDRQGSMLAIPTLADGNFYRTAMALLTVF
jgi:hypothetical protein